MTAYDRAVWLRIAAKFSRCTFAVRVQVADLLDGLGDDYCGGVADGLRCARHEPTTETTRVYAN